MNLCGKSSLPAKPHSIAASETGVEQVGNLVKVWWKRWSETWWVLILLGFMGHMRTFSYTRKEWARQSESQQETTAKRRTIRVEFS